MKKLLLQNKAINIDLALLIIRITIGLLMAFYGWYKFQNYTEMVNSDFWQKQVNFIGFTGMIPLVLTIFAELICSIFLLVGLFTRLSLIPLIICMGFIVFKLDHFEIVSNTENGLEMNSAFTYLMIYCALFFTGSGKYSLDSLIKR